MRNKTLSLPFLARPAFWVFFLWSVIGLTSTYWVIQVLPTKEAPKALIVDSSTTQVGEQAKQTQSRSYPKFASLLTGNDQEAIMRAKKRLSLIGVVAKNTGQGAALIKIDSDVVKPFRVGQNVIDHFVLLSVSPRKAHLDGFVLEMPVDPGAISDSSAR